MELGVIFSIDCKLKSHAGPHKCFDIQIQVVGYCCELSLLFEVCVVASSSDEVVLGDDD